MYKSDEDLWSTSWSIEYTEMKTSVIIRVEYLITADSSGYSQEVGQARLIAGSRWLSSADFDLRLGYWI